MKPSDDADYFSHEQVGTWGIEAFWGLPESPRTPYYRTYETALGPAAHLYEFVVPMVPPTWNDPDQVARYAEALGETSRPTAVALGSLDVCAPAVAHGEDWYEHWGLTHFLLDGHHKLQAAAESGAQLQLLSLLSYDAGLATRDQVARIPDLRRSPPSARARPLT